MLPFTNFFVAWVRLMFEHFSLAPPDSILGLNAAFDKDPRDGKLNLTVGVFKDDAGRTPILESVKLAEAKIFQDQKTKGYLPIEGGKDYIEQVNRLVLGPEFDMSRVATAHTQAEPVPFALGPTPYRRCLLEAVFGSAIQLGLTTTPCSKQRVLRRSATAISTPQKPVWTSMACCIN